MKQIKIELDEQVELNDSSNWIFERSDWPGYFRAIRLKRNHVNDFVVDEIFESVEIVLQDLIEKNTGTSIWF